MPLFITIDKGLLSASVHEDEFSYTLGVSVEEISSTVLLFSNN